MAQTIYRTPDGQDRRLGNPAYDGRFVFTRIRYSGPSYGGARWRHDYPAADFYLSDALGTLTRMRVNGASTNVLDLEDDRIFDNPILYISEPGYRWASDKGAQNLRQHLLKGGSSSSMISSTPQGASVRRCEGAIGRSRKASRRLDVESLDAEGSTR